MDRPGRRDGGRGPHAPRPGVPARVRTGPWRDIASWAGITVGAAKAGAEGLELARYRDEDGRELLDLPERRCPTRTSRRPSASCPIGTRTCSSTRAGRGSCPSRTARGSSARRTRSRSGHTSWTAASSARGHCAMGASCSTRSRSSRRRDGARSSASARPSRPSTPDRLNASVRRLPAAASVAAACVARVGWPGA